MKIPSWHWHCLVINRLLKNQIIFIRYGYIHNELLRELNIENKVVDAYFSDHDAVLAQFVRFEFCSDGLQQPNGMTQYVFMLK